MRLLRKSLIRSLHHVTNQSKGCVEASLEGVEHGLQFSG
jgi:hypothetical protein